MANRGWTENAAILTNELAWLASVIEGRVSQQFQQQAWTLPPPPAIDSERSAYGELVQQGELGAEERLVLILALAPHLRPAILDALFVENRLTGRPSTEIGGISGSSHRGFLPTCETAAFLLAGSNLEQRLATQRLFQHDHFFQRQGILVMERPSYQETLFSAPLKLSPESLQWLTTGERSKEAVHGRLPARLITTQLNWEDLVLAPEVREEIATLQTWLDRGPSAMQEWGLQKHVKPGYRALFYGPPGTGKTLTATLIGAVVCMDVYRVDLSMFTSRHGGDLNKRLLGAFDQALNNNCILYFDQADALFGSHGGHASSLERHAGPAAYQLLQEIENFSGVAILSCHLRSNLDEAFARHFQSIIYFPMPDPEQRLALWYGLFGPLPRLDPDVDLRIIADNYPLSGGAIANVARHAVMRALSRQRKQVTQEDLLVGIRRELAKDGKIVA